MFSSAIGFVLSLFRWELPDDLTPRQEIPLFFGCCVLIWTVTLPGLPVLAGGATVAAVLWWAEPIVLSWVMRTYPAPAWFRRLSRPPPPPEWFEE